MENERRSAFSDGQMNNWSQNLIHRCRDCMICQSCRRTPRPQDFHASSRTCRSCAAPIHCSRCETPKDPTEFDAGEVFKHLKNCKTNMICKACIDEGLRWTGCVDSVPRQKPITTKIYYIYIHNNPSRFSPVKLGGGMARSVTGYIYIYMTLSG